MKMYLNKFIQTLKYLIISHLSHIFYTPTTTSHSKELVVGCSSLHALHTRHCLYYILHG